jgi:hypothetical protein
MLERVRFEREIETLGLAGDREFVVSTNEYGDALAWYAKEFDVSDDVFRWLKQSPTYMAVVKKLGKKYVHYKIKKKPVFVSDAWGMNAEGVFTKGTYKGRRFFDVEYSSNGTYFAPYGSPDNSIGSDVIYLEPPDPHRQRGAYTLDENGRWVELIAHESVHAFRRVSGLRRSGKTAGDRIQSGIDDEIATRKAEGKIVGEIRKKSKKFRKYTPTTGSTDRWAVERDFFPGQQKRTYLEHFVLSERLQAAWAPLSGDEVDADDKLVARIDLGKHKLAHYVTANPTYVDPDTGKETSFKSRYACVRFMMRVIDARWRAIRDLDSRDLYHDAGLEKCRQQHADAFFKGLASYTPVP